jgi:hypothetical protein
MPTIFRSGRVVIRMFADDHDPPHFHITTPDSEMIVALSDFVTLRGSVRKRDYDVAMHWAKANSSTLWTKWEELNAHRQ